MMNVFPHPPASAVTRILGEAGLPCSDLTPAHLEHFFGCGSTGAPDGIVGLELYESVALLRSLAVSSKCRGRGCGTALVEQAELFARAQGARQIYLLTTTAERFFERLGYARVPREAAPVAIQRTQEFSTLCSSSSAFMVKSLPTKEAFTEIARFFDKHLGK
jgi:amino-acid N-acetyltransferase